MSEIREIQVYAPICGVPGPLSGVHTTRKVVATLKTQQASWCTAVKVLPGVTPLLWKIYICMSNLSSLLHLLNQLLKSHNNPWKWSQWCDKVFQQAKDNLVKAPFLTHYDPIKKLTLAIDASAYGIGTVLSHIYDDGTERLIAYASRTLSNTEKRYAQIDRGIRNYFWNPKVSYLPLWLKICTCNWPQALGFTVWS